MKRMVAWFRSIKPMRVYRAYSLAGGNLSAAGMSFQALFAVFAAIWVAFAILGIYLKGNKQLSEALIRFINLQIPGLIGKNGLIDPDALYSTTTLSVSGAVALGVLAWTAVLWIDYARVAMHRMFGVPKQITGYIYLKIGDFLIAIAYGLFVLIGAIISVFATSFFKDILTMMGITGDPGFSFSLLTRIISMIIVILLDTVMVALMIRLLSGVTVAWHFLWPGALLGGLALGAMKIAGASLLGGATRNPLFGSVAVFIGVLIWFNLTSRIMLLTAEWMATSMRDAGVDPKDVGWVVTADSLRLKTLRERRKARLEAKAAAKAAKFGS